VKVVEAIKSDDEKKFKTRPIPEPKVYTLDSMKWGLITVSIIFAFVGGAIRFGLALV
jgi:hypothetical protein